MKKKKVTRRKFLWAAMFGSIAGVAVVKGEVVAGDSFKGGVYPSFPGPLGKPLVVTVSDSSASFNNKRRKGNK